MRDYWKEKANKVINKRKLIITIAITVIIVIGVAMLLIYINNETAREWIDKKVLRKEVMQDNVTTIDLKEEQHSNIYAFQKYIGILNKNQFNIYNNTGNAEKSLEIQISNPIFSSANRFLVIGEKDGEKLYLLEDKEIAFETDIEGKISQIHVNKNGYVAVVISETIYKTVIAMYNPEGTRLFKTYLSTTRTVDVSISNDNKYLAIAEVDTSGTMIQSNIKIISVEKASSDPTNSLDHTYQGENNELITNIKYQDKDKLVCMYTDKIKVIENEQNNTLIDNENKKAIFQSIELNNHATQIEEKSSGLFTADSVVNIVNIENKTTKQYTAQAVVKEIYTYGDIIALNLGTEIEFLNTERLASKTIYCKSRNYKYCGV